MVLKRLKRLSNSTTTITFTTNINITLWQHFASHAILLLWGLVFGSLPTSGCACVRACVRWHSTACYAMPAVPACYCMLCNACCTCMLCNACCICIILHAVPACYCMLLHAMQCLLLPPAATSGAVWGTPGAVFGVHTLRLVRRKRGCATGHAGAHPTGRVQGHAVPAFPTHCAWRWGGRGGQ